MTNAPTKDQLKQWDAEDPLKWTRDEFELPDAKECGGDVGESSRSGNSLRLTSKLTVRRHWLTLHLPDGKAVYFCGNSLGLLSKRARKHVMEELDTWSRT